MFEETERDLLRKVAIGAAARAMGLRSAPTASPGPAAAATPAGLSFEGIFVTWLKEGRPRGRSGTLAPDAPLYTLVEKHSVDALLHDPRVPPATAKELPRYMPQISVLSTFEEIPGAEGLLVGTHGVIAEK
jgi:AMMECR1 domain-containing protein